METELDELLERAVTLTSERFDLYHVGFYLLDRSEENALLIASNGETGNLLKESGHRLPVGSDSNVGYVCLIGESRLAVKNDETTPQISQHPLLPYTQSQLVVPLRVGEKILGAIDLQSDRIDNFDDTDTTIFRTMADQLAIAIQKNEYRQEVVQTLLELEAAYGEFTQEAWQRFTQTKKAAPGYRFRQYKTEIVDETLPEVRTVWESGQAVIINREESTDGSEAPSVVAVPMKIRGQVIGVLNLQFDSNRITNETSSMIEEIANRLSLVMENARLIEAAQQRVKNERLTSEIANRMRETLDMDTVVQTTVQELATKLGLQEVEIRIGYPELENNGTSPAQSGNGHKNGSSQSEQ
jgi:GAF domain-containing protein